MNKYFYELFGKLERQGPGDTASTLHAYMLMRLPDSPDVLDLGCGTGSQTMALAANTSAVIKAIDSRKPFIDELNKKIQTAGLRHRATAETGDFTELGEKPGFYDAVWSEGAVFSIGFEKGITYWKQFIKPGGYAAVSDVAWLTDDRPAELEKFWRAEYPPIATPAQNLQVISRCGYTAVDAFVLPSYSWTLNYYRPMAVWLKWMKDKYAGVKEAQEVVSMYEREIAMYAKYSKFYGYVFYVMKKER
ncbi:MAG: methyltransferase domain-containing protein [Spirochaetia bacterium]|nr:methyltransferase domain-containing protein [Spirochaetia bacterium]